MGVTSLSEIIDDGFRFIAATGMVSFGGICVAMQTAAVAVDMGMGGYFAGKALQTVFSVLLAVLVWQLSKLGWIGYLIFGCVCAAIFALFRTKTKNKGSIVVKAGV